MSFYSPYRWCVVPTCNSCTLKTPKKLFIIVPDIINLRNIWLELAGRDPTQLSTKSLLHLCEDHFNIEEDMENHMQFKVMGSVKKIRMKPNTIPSKFSNKQSVSTSQATENTSTNVHPGSSTSYLKDEKASHTQQRAKKEVRGQVKVQSTELPVMEYTSVQAKSQMDLKIKHRMTSPITLSKSVTTSPHVQIIARNVPCTSGVTRPVKTKLSVPFKENSDSEVQAKYQMDLKIKQRMTSPITLSKSVTSECILIACALINIQDTHIRLIKLL